MPLPPLVAPAHALSAAERERTARHAVLAGLGDIGQRRLAAATVAVVGVGGLGSPVILSLAAAGVGTIVVIDDDTVDSTNLQRQVVHRISDVGASKVDSAVRAAADLSPETTVIAHRERLDPSTAPRLLAGADLVIDGTDSFDSRADVAAACEERGLPLVWGVIQEFHAQVTVFWSAPPAGVSPVVLSDLYPPATVGEPPSCADVGVLGALCVQVGGLMSIEAIKLITGIGDPALGRVILLDALQGTQRSVPLLPSTASAATAAPASTPAAASTVASAGNPAGPPDIVDVDLEGLRAAQARGAVILDVREPHETATGMLDGAVAIPLGEVLAAPDTLGLDSVVVVCERGARARRAAAALRARGVDATVLRGGWAAWRA